MSNPYGIEEVSVTKIALPNIVIDGFEVVVPAAPLGEFGVILHPKALLGEIVVVPFVNLTGAHQLVNVGGAYLGHSVKESTGNAAAEIDLYDGTGSGGILLCPITLNANESIRDWFPLPGVTVTGGLWADVTAGEVSGAVYFATLAENE